MGRRPVNPSDSRRFRDWVQRAGEDIVAAHLLMADDRCYNAAAFHCQQGIEKALKAYILVCTGNLVDGHNLSWLCKQAMRHDERFRDWLDESAALNRCYIETRYPTDIPTELGERETRRFYLMAFDMFVFICQQVEVAAEFRPSVSLPSR